MITNEFLRFYNSAIQPNKSLQVKDRHDPRDINFQRIPNTARAVLPVYERTMTTAGNNSDSGVLPQPVEGLLATSVLERIGARMIDIGMLDSDSNYPYESKGLTTEWLAEDGSITKADAGFENFAISPKVVGCGVEFSRHLRKQNIYDTAAQLEMMARRDLGKAVENAFFVGTGTTNQPTGLTVNSTISAAAIDATAGMTAALFDNAIEALEDGEVESENLFILANADTKKDLKGIQYHGEYLWQTETNRQYCGGIPALVQRSLPDGTLLIGDFSKALIVTSGTFDVNAISSKGGAVGASGGVEMYAFLTTDIVIGQPAAFQLIENI